MGYHLPGQRRRLSKEVRQRAERHVDQAGGAKIDWADAQARAAQLKILVGDAEAVLELASEQADDVDVRTMGWLLTKVLWDDVVTSEQGDRQTGVGTASDRMISMTDLEVRQCAGAAHAASMGSRAVVLPS
jgi:hypothetical protein